MEEVYSRFKISSKSLDMGKSFSINAVHKKVEVQPLNTIF